VYCNLRCCRHEAFEPFNVTKSLQRIHLTPGVPGSDVRTQEHDVIWRQSTYGSDYNVNKFLQDHPHIPTMARKEPTEVMSASNQNLKHVPVIFPISPEPFVPFPPAPKYDVIDLSTKHGDYRRRDDKKTGAYWVSCVLVNI